MTSTDAVIGTEALLGRQLTDFETKLVRQIVAKGMSPEETWSAIWMTLDLKTSSVVKRMIAYRVQAAGKDYDATATALREDVELRMKRAGWD